MDLPLFPEHLSAEEIKVIFLIQSNSEEKFPPQHNHHLTTRLRWRVRLAGLKGEGQPQVKLMVCQRVSGLRITEMSFAGRSLKQIKWFPSLSLTTLAR